MTDVVIAFAVMVTSSSAPDTTSGNSPEQGSSPDDRGQSDSGNDGQDHA